ncbi:Nucleotidylyl transferase [Gymnopus androsaceus JB14]|uniref:tryptophan--tRNA ligase n=1 Tax=Gymnopus androsaceus JB14 TaxID=1447944 RepID=A0A6A4HV96_9AGAR|nr:Nucleotidylyl transferase [Gymnopus androsaceus JB14]
MSGRTCLFSTSLRTQSQSHELLSTLQTPSRNGISNELSKTGRGGGGGRVILSGIQPTGVPHLGNYLGALSNWVRLQNQPENQLFFSIVGWHAITLPQSPSELVERKLDMLAVVLFFFQEHNPNHTELAWIFNCLTPMGKLRRMTTWKSRLAASKNLGDAQVDETGLNVGLFTYPVLQAADILLYKATHVPVGDDQTQHLELCRDIADQFNRTFKGKGKERMFPLPVQLNTPISRILSLRDPTSKMSKSTPDPQSRILLTDSFSQISSKIRSAVTDSTPGITYDPVGRPGTANLLRILRACNEINTNTYTTQGENKDDSDAALYSLASHYASKNHGALKADVAEAIEEMLKRPRAEYEKIRREEVYLRRVAREGVEKAERGPEVTMREVRERVGLV